MQPGERRRLRNNGIVAGSVWENRIKLDQVKGGIKVFNDGETEENDADIEGIRLHGRLTRNQSDVLNVEKRKRRSWKPPEPVNIIQLRKCKSESLNYENEEEEDEDVSEVIEEIKEVDDKQIDLPIEKVEFNDVEEKKNVTGSLIVDAKVQKIEVEDEILEIGSETTKKVQSIVDLVMWRDVSKSAFIFGLGTFILLSSSYTKDLNFSFISAMSYLGLAYLFLIFLYKSILRRGNAEFNEKEEKRIIGEEEAIFVLRFLLPYINEVLIKLRALFSGDLATTMKLAVLLFLTARCGSSITIWTLAKLMFLGVFTVPKFISTYSIQLARYGKFWLQRFRDGWESCTHKKVVVAAVFIIIWNISSTVARIWALFMLVVAVKYYQQYAEEFNAQEVEEEINVTRKQKTEEEDTKAEFSPGNNINRHKLHHRQKSGPKEIIKAKKWT